MEFFSDWKFWLFVVTIIGALMNWLANYKLMNNHLHHLSIDIKSVITKQDAQAKDIKIIETDLAFLKGNKESENKVISLLENTLKNK